VVPDPRDPGTVIQHPPTSGVEVREVSNVAEPSTLGSHPDPRDPGAAAQHPAVSSVGATTDHSHAATTAASPPAENQGVGGTANYSSATDGQAYFSATGAALDARDPGASTHASTTNVEANHVVADQPAPTAVDTTAMSGSVCSGFNTATAESSQQQAEGAQHQAEAAQRR
jgi:hypothetical protein